MRAHTHTQKKQKTKNKKKNQELRNKLDILIDNLKYCKLRVT